MCSGWAKCTTSPLVIAAIVAATVLAALLDAATRMPLLEQPRSGCSLSGASPEVLEVAEDVRVSILQHVETHSPSRRSGRGGGRDDYKQPLCVIVAATDHSTCSQIGELAGGWASLARCELIDHTHSATVAYGEWATRFLQRSDRSDGVLEPWQTLLLPQLSADTIQAQDIPLLHRLCDEKAPAQPSSVVVVGVCVLGDDGRAVREDDGDTEGTLRTNATLVVEWHFRFAHISCCPLRISVAVTVSLLSAAVHDAVTDVDEPPTEEELDAMFSRVAGRVVVVGGGDAERSGTDVDDEDGVLRRTDGLRDAARRLPVADLTHTGDGRGERSPMDADNEVASPGTDGLRDEKAPLDNADKEVEPPRKDGPGDAKGPLDNEVDGSDTGEECNGEDADNEAEPPRTDDPGDRKDPLGNAGGGSHTGDGHEERSGKDADNEVEAQRTEGLGDAKGPLDNAVDGSHTGDVHEGRRAKDTDNEAKSIRTDDQRDGRVERGGTERMTTK